MSCHILSRNNTSQRKRQIPVLTGRSCVRLGHGTRPNCHWDTNQSSYSARPSAKHTRSSLRPHVVSCWLSRFVHSFILLFAWPGRHASVYKDRRPPHKKVLCSSSEECVLPTCFVCSLPTATTTTSLLLQNILDTLPLHPDASVILLERRQLVSVCSLILTRGLVWSSQADLFGRYPILQPPTLIIRALPHCLSTRTRPIKALDLASCICIPPQSSPITTSESRLSRHHTTHPPLLA